MNKQNIMFPLIEVNYDLQAQCELKEWPYYIYDDSSQELFCRTVWDSVYCWPPTPPGILVERSCFEIFQETYPQYAAYLNGKVTRKCLIDGTWADGNSSNYDDCAEAFESYLDGIDDDNFSIPMVHQMLFFGSILSLLSLGASIAIFHHFPCLHCDRVGVHLQLMYSLVLRFVLMLIISEPFIIGHSSSYRDVEVLCKPVLVGFLYTTFSSVSWMFVEGLFLNVVLMTSAGTLCKSYQFTLFVIGWGVPALFVGIHVIAMVLKNEESCWEGYSGMDEIWILLGPISLELVINGLFLINILRILLKKIRNSNSQHDTSQLKVAVKAIAILFPVLGINNLVLLYNPGGNYKKYFVLLNTFFGSTQGIFVSIVFCFADKEVRAAIQRAIERRKARQIDTPTRTQNDFLLDATALRLMLSPSVNIQNNNMILEHTV